MTKDLKKNKEHLSMIFIPDISGFTKYVHGIDVKLRKEIISELLSTILNTNILNLKVSEIEGDSILFYRYGTLPTFKDLMNQYEIMLITFKRKLRELTQGRPSLIPELSLKLLVDYGTIAEYKQFRFRKLEVAIVVAHKLLRNNIPSQNYILVTKEFLHQFQNQKANEIILPEWVTQRTTEVDGSLFTYFLYDTEILKGNVLQERKKENPD